MEVSGFVSSRPSFFSGEIGVSSSRRPSLHMLKSSSMIVPPSGFSDDGHLQYYGGGLKLKAVSTRCGGGGAVKETESASKKNMKMLKKRLKLLKGLSKDATFFADMEIGWNSNNVQQDDESAMEMSKGRTITEATELLMGQLKQLKEKEKELKMKRKQEKAKLKAERKRHPGCEEDSSSSSSSESSDDEQRGQVMNMSSLTTALAGGNIKNELQSPQAAIAVLPENRINEIPSSSAVIETQANPETKMIQVCMGGKCKKMGSSALMEEFQKTVGVEIAVVGCKCMGKCRTAPNVKVHDVEQRLLVAAAAEDEGEEVEKKRSSIPLLCTGVGIEDVGMIVSNL